MLDRFLQLLDGRFAPAAAGSEPLERRHIAAAVLLVEATQFDEQRHRDDAASIIEILQSTFHFRTEVAAQIVDIAEERLASRRDGWVFAEAVRTGFSLAERQELLTMLWELVYHDGRLLAMEDQMMSRLANQLGLTGDAIEAARTLALARSPQLGQRQCED